MNDDMQAHPIMPRRKSILPPNWYKLPDSKLEDYLDMDLPDEDQDDILYELDNRDRQRDANTGAMNGVAPER